MDRRFAGPWVAAGLMFKWLRTQNQFMAVIKDDRYSPDEKFAEYNRILVRYKFELSRRADFDTAALFKKMLDENAAQFLDIFVQALPEVEARETEFDFGQPDEAAE